MKSYKQIGLFLFFIFSGVVVQSSVASSVANSVQLEPLSAKEISFLVGRLVEPPSDGGKVFRADIETLLDVQKNRTPEQCAEAKLQAHLSIQTFFVSPQEKMPPDSFFQELLNWCRPVIGEAKDRYNRPRPYVLDSRILPCLPKETSSSYPSGHSVLSGLVGSTLIELYPEQKTEFYARMHSISKNRIVSGLHYPSDTVVGEEFGQRLFTVLKQNKNYSAWVRQYAVPVLKKPLKQPLKSR